MPRASVATAARAFIVNCNDGDVVWVANALKLECVDWACKGAVPNAVGARAKRTARTRQRPTCLTAGLFGRHPIKRGSATFINSTELNPTLQATGEYLIRQPNREAINIQIVVGGTLRKPNISLTSDAQPPIPQSDLLSYLAFGQSSSSLVQLEGSGLTNGSGGSNVVGAGAALASKQLAGIAIGVLADQVAGSAAQSLGADVFTITPADVQTDVGNFLRATQFEFGKYIKSHSFVAVKSPLDPKALVRPGIQLVHRFGGLRGYRMETGVDTRYLLREPTLQRDQNVATTSAFGAFLIREWRF